MGESESSQSRSRYCRFACRLDDIAAAPARNARQYTACQWPAGWKRHCYSADCTRGLPADIGWVPCQCLRESGSHGRRRCLEQRTSPHIRSRKSAEIVSGTDAGEVTGILTNDKRELVKNAVVALVPESPVIRLRPTAFRNGLSDADGKFRIGTVPPGHHRICLGIRRSRFVAGRGIPQALRVRRNNDRGSGEWQSGNAAYRSSATVT